VSYTKVTYRVPDVRKENKRRLEELFSEYDPELGIGSPIERVPFQIFSQGHLLRWQVPEEFLEEPVVKFLLDHASIEEMIESVSGKYIKRAHAEVLNGLDTLRFKYDFEYWAFKTVTIQDKLTKTDIPFKLNRPQRKVLKVLEDMRKAGVPVRIIILKARQWGGSTLVQIYMAWLQLIHKKSWHSAVIADVEDQARNIRGMYSKLAREYPKKYGQVKFNPHEGSSKNRVIDGRGCIVGVGSVQKPESLRSFDFAMVHMSEVGLWKSTPARSAEDLAQAIRASVPNQPMSLVVMESTAKGVGNFFHKEWLSASGDESGYKPVFVAWWEIEIYQMAIEEEEFTKWVRLLDEDKYAQFLWELGATLEGIKWYFTFKKGEGFSDWRMMSEFPSTAHEAFQSTGSRVFPPAYVLQARKTCKPPIFIGDLYGDAMKGEESMKNVRLEENSSGSLKIWKYPDLSVPINHRYAIFGDIGGRSEGADYSVLKVFDRYWMMEGGVPEVVAVWRGHIDQDLFAWKAVQLGMIYGNELMGYPLIAMESNSLNKMESEGGDHFLTILDEIVEFYDNIYTRTDPEKIKEGMPVQWGFHTNRKTKTMIINKLVGALRDGGYIERSHNACDEMDVYEVKQNGSFGAVEGEHDDELITTAGGVWLTTSYMDLPYEIKQHDSNSGNSRGIVSEASI
jgi:hypothetical protein